MPDLEKPRSSGTAVARAAAKRPPGKGTPPPRDNTLGALKAAPDEAAKKSPKPAEKPAKPASRKRTEPLNFRVATDFRRAFKRAAATQDCKKVELLERIFTEWSARNPG
jgi:hypothetical protein